MPTIIKNVPFIGGDTQSFEYDFGLKVANSVAACPMKLYRNSIDVTSPPVPTDSSWIEVTDQKTLDKLKAQNEIPITSTDFTNRTAVWNGKNLVLQTDSIPAVRDDFTGKVNGSVAENPHISKVSGLNSNTPTLLIPTDNSFIEINASGTAYGIISSLNNTSYSMSTNIANSVPQQLFSFNLIRMLEDKYGSLPCPNDTASKVAWLKQNISKIVANWYGFGVNPTGNKANLTVWSGSAWSTTILTNSSTSPSVLNYSITSDKVQSDGFVYYLAYTDASDGVTTSTIYTDYISLNVQLKPMAGYDLLVPSNPRRDAVTNGNYDNIVMAEKVYNQVMSDFTGKVAGSIAENPNITKITGATTLTIPSGFTTEVDQAGINMLKILDGTCKPHGVGASNGYIPQQLFQFNLVAIFEKQYGTIPATDKVSWLKANISKIQCDWYGYGTCPSGNKAHFVHWNPSISQWHPWDIDNVHNTTNSPSKLSVGTGSDQINIFIDSNGIASYLAYTDASDGITASTIYTDYIKLTINFNNGNNSLEYFTNNSVEMAVQTTSKSSAYLVECDLMPIANALYGGSNSALKSALKALQVDVWASGYGANSNDIKNGVVGQLYSYVSNGWTYSNLNWGSDAYSANWTNVITSSSIIPNKSWGQYMDTTNKIYILIVSTNNSTVDVPSVVNLDYLKLRIDLTRTPDVISNPPTINLTDTFSMLIRGFSPAWDSINSKIKLIMNLYKDDNNRCALQFTNPTTLDITKRINGTWLGSSSTTTLSLNKFQIANILLNVDAINITLYILYNNGTIQKKQFSNNGFIKGATQLYLLQEYDGFYQADAFLDSIIYMPNQVWDDASAEEILRGTKEGFEFPELFDINAVTLHANATRANGVITLNATGAYQNSYQFITILPNNKYTLSYQSTGGYMVIEEYYNNSLLKTTSLFGMNTLDFTTTDKTNNVKIRTSNSSSGPFTFSSISLKLKM